ncbi:hypothetical protein THTE_3314 [Thermogutta terrifontis]|uniref:Uncharacterized protein n=1 Tax=Thermogutta terrifontis TaxID=1331910 RepID=A0A286RIZ4_9BACT|nr:hypothetical protein THTE_3314 [Thermogutta terrifontis]
MLLQKMRHFSSFYSAVERRLHFPARTGPGSGSIETRWGAG